MSNVKRHHDPRAKCEVCGKLLDYNVGSILWECQNRDLCIDHQVEEMFDNGRESNNEQ